MQQLQPLRRYLAVQRGYAGDVSARSVHAGDKSGCDRIGADSKQSGWSVSPPWPQALTPRFPAPPIRLRDDGPIPLRAPAGVRYCLPPTCIRSPRCGPRQSQPWHASRETRAGGSQTVPAIPRRDILSPAFLVAARGRPAAIRRHCRATRRTPSVSLRPPLHLRCRND